MGPLVVPEERVDDLHGYQPLGREYRQQGMAFSSVAKFPLYRDWTRQNLDPEAAASSDGFHL